MKNILFGIVMMFTALHADFSRDNATDIVTDNSTTLQWQDDAVGATMKWEAAISYCEDLTLGSHENWRLPNFNELYYIADRSKRDPAINSTFQNVVSNGYWSSTTVVGYSDYAWSVNGFYGGGDGWNGKDYSNYVRCVRDG